MTQLDKLTQDCRGIFNDEVQAMRRQGMTDQSIIDRLVECVADRQARLEIAGAHKFGPASVEAARGLE